MNYTSIEQSKRLLELGLDAESADMSWMNNKYPECVPYDVTLKHANTKDFLYLPCWSVGALIDLLPIGTHTCSHITDAGITYECYTEKENFECLTILDAVFSMIEWLLENKLLYPI